MYIDKKTKKRLSKKSVLFLVSIVVVIAVLVIGLVMLLTKGREVKDTLVTMPFSTDDTYFCVGNTVVYAEGDLLTCMDTSLNTVWQLRLYSGGLNFTSSDNVIMATSDNVIQVVGSDGGQLFSTQLNGTIHSARAGKDKVAVSIEQVLTDKTLSYIIVFDLKGNSLFQIDISDKYVLDYGFDSQSDLLYLLELDASGTAPVSRISTYRPETQAKTGIKELKDQLVGSVYLIDNAIYAAGTNRLTMYTSSDLSKKVLVYGWVLEDIYISNSPRFVYVPSSEKGGFIDSTRIIRTTGDETKINLPPNVFSILDAGEKIYCFATNNLFVYTSEGNYLRTHALPDAIDSAKKAMDGYVFLTQGENVYLLPLP